jgi:FkbM family methyltransferase
MTHAQENHSSVLDRERLRSVGKALPYPLRAAIKWGIRQPSRGRKSVELARTKYRIDAAGRSGKTVRLLDFDVHINHGPTPYQLYEDIFVNGVYDFVADRPDPRILDCGSNIGMSALYFKHLYPQARIVGFEPDPSILGFLRENIENNGLQDVEIVNAALAAQEGTITLSSDGGAASHLDRYRPEGSSTEWIPFDVPCVKLSDYLDERVDFMKMNIEGAEYEVLSECESRIGQIEQMNIEYHRLPGVPCTLHPILDLLHRNGFTYVVSDFGLVMYGSARPPARIDRHALYWRQIYAHQNP